MPVFCLSKFHSRVGLIYVNIIDELELMSGHDLPMALKLPSKAENGNTKNDLIDDSYKDLSGQNSKP